jgi:hypothetical protein
MQKACLKNGFLFTSNTSRTAILSGGTQ